ncbi:hypothetical protein BO94DRAFT_234438 [Aspergillus sclerotioniger CBS 115572]|uniref:Uncharacterized protein n=1 Tax=Aspergillus sclerotioniger CBS 115572 TaxID=1450535 RepID=A0A317VL01_9EURO|nr:hypothetical protein BO94DRAFT_234438 [Aspergillus sclerotioniger CBS 115572]PWY73797.1 hypothetical protein BO94DRAFT_234438 [Aspergillus sclerotioniger CBS 115572]
MGAGVGMKVRVLKERNPRPTKVMIPPGKNGRRVCGVGSSESFVLHHHFLELDLPTDLPTCMHTDEYVHPQLQR